MNLLPWLAWNWQWLIQPLYLLGITFLATAFITLPAVPLYRLSHPWPVELLGNHLLRPSLPKMSTTIMKLIKNDGYKAIWYHDFVAEAKQISSWQRFYLVVGVARTGESAVPLQFLIRCLCCDELDNKVTGQPHGRRYRNIT